MNTIEPKIKAFGEVQATGVRGTAVASHRTRIILAGAVGNVLEWYDFGLYGLLAPVLA